MLVKMFLGACFLTGCLLVPHAGIAPTAKGFAIAGAVLWLWSRLGPGSPG